MAGSNRDEKGSIQADISQDVIDAALKSVERRAQPPPEDEGVPEGMRTLEVDLPEGGLTLEVDVPASVFGEAVSEAEAESGASALRAALHESHRELGEVRQQLEQARRELEEARAQLELSQSKSRETMERLKESHERALRATADLENYKKRAQKEKEEIQKFGSERLLKDFLPVIDNLDRAMEAAQKSADFESLRTGVEMTRKLFESTFGKHGVKGFSAVGQPFDPRLHEAMQQVESAEVPAGHVLYEAVRGYTLNERLMRPALVVVARAPATTSDEQTGTTPKGSE
ncbi:nucleotide exchange factor GrpE [Archangium violaceum]|uniref:nucleotide exchange factor GrpE n=1 Tax=Archangium violaceum TaxID=83451 RepID=UPI00193B591A|nr:nucleotide exchange factor GrpE [Archangium violaceum]QRK09942.1 nucleotide exchange factor GrpE [Archangium violaceum]